MTELTDAEVLEWLPEEHKLAFIEATRTGLRVDSSRLGLWAGRCETACRHLAETRKALANSMESHRKLAVWPESCLDWPESALDEIGKMKETACEQWLEDERLLKGEQS